MHKQHQRVSVMLKRLALTVCASTFLSVSALAQQPFTYQGFLRVNGLPANGEFDFRFRLFDSATGTNQVGTTVIAEDKQVRQGFYTVVLDFGNVWTGGQRWLEIAIRPGNQTGNYTTLSPRVQLTPVPLAHQAFSVPWSGVTGFTIASPLTGAGTSSNPLRLVNGTSAGQILKWNGTQWALATDNDTTYSAGAGLSLSGTTFSIASGGVTTGMLADGAVTSAKLSTTGVTAGTYGSATQVGVFTVDAQGRITSASNVSISGVSPGGAAGGDLSGSYPNPTVARIQGRAVATTAPSTGQVLKWSGSAWTPAPDNDTTYSAGAGLSLSGTTFSIASGGIVTGMLADGAVTDPKIVSVSWSKITGAPSFLTGITAQNPLTGAGTSSNPLRLVNGTSAGQILKWNGTQWALATDNDTTYSAGAGLSLSGTTFSIASGGVTTGMLADGAVTNSKLADGSVTDPKIVSVSWSKITGAPSFLTGITAQNPLTGTGTSSDPLRLINGTSAGQILKWNGTQWALATDNDTTYSAGAGLSLSGTTFSIASGGVTTGMLADGAVTNSKLADGSVTDPKIVSVSWSKITGAPSSFPPSGTAGGDLSGSYPNPTVARIQGRAVATTAPSTGQVLKWDGSAWTPAADSDTSYWSASGSNIYNNNPGFVGIGVQNPVAPLHVVGDSTAVYARITSVIGGALIGITQSGANGVWGVSTGGGTAIQGTDSGSGWAGFFDGQVEISFDSSPDFANLIIFEDDDSYGRIEFYNRRTLNNGRVWQITSRISPSRSDDALNIWNSAVGDVIRCNGDGDVRVLRDLRVGRNLTVQGTKQFYIDHPLDPENYYLVHYCSESSEPHVYYSGTVMLDASGEAWVQLPYYFESIARDPRYTLTPVGAPMPNLHVAVEVQGNRFKIAGGVPGKRVSWRVEAIRNDPYVRLYGYQDEVPKSEKERGKYLLPELYGQPRERSIDYDEETAPRPALARPTKPQPQRQLPSAILK